jgi:Protein of unknown function (DUF2845).
MLMLCATPTRASAEGFRCPKNDRLVEVGDSEDQVKEICGPPESRKDVMGTVCETNDYCYLAKIGERWVYDFGPSYFKRYLLFQDGHLTQVELGMYGKAR